MPAPNDAAPPMEYVPSATNNRRGPTQLQNIGLGRFKDQGGGHNFLPGSAAALLHQKKMEQRLDAWLGRETTKDYPEGARGKDRAEVDSGIRDGITTGIATTMGDQNHGATERLHTATKDAASDKTALENVTKHSRKHDVANMDWHTLSHNDNLSTTNLTRHIKATAGSWGHCRIEDSKRAAQKATAAAYATTAVTIDVVNGDLIATVEPTQPLATEVTSQPVPIQPLKSPAMENLHLHSAEPVKGRARRTQIAMFSDGSDDETSSAEKPLSVNPNKNRKTAHREAIPQQRRVRFVSPSSSPEEDQTTDKTKNDTTSLDSSQSSFNLKGNLDPGELSDDEDSDLYQPSKLPPAIPPATTLPPDSQPWAYKPQPQPREQRQNTYPPRRKGTAGPPTPKRARVPSPEPELSHTPNTNIDPNDDHSEIKKSSTNDNRPASKKAKLQPHTTTTSSFDSQSSPNHDVQEKKAAAPFRKKGIATKVVKRKR